MSSDETSDARSLQMNDKQVAGDLEDIGVRVLQLCRRMDELERKFVKLYSEQLAAEREERGQMNNKQ